MLVLIALYIVLRILRTAIWRKLNLSGNRITVEAGSGTLLLISYLWKYSGKDSVDACLDCAGDGTERCRVDAKDDDEINVFRGPPPWDSVNFSARPLIWRVSAV